MKKLMMIAIAFLTLNTIAQDKKERKEFMKELSAEEVATLQTKKLTLQLDLTQSQQSQVKSLILKEAKHRESQRTVREEKKENSKKPTKEERYKMVNERLDRQIEMKKEMKTILNKEQYEKWEAVNSKKKQKRHHKNKSDRKH